MSDTDEIAHSKRGPSTAHRWRKCPASVRASAGHPNTAGIEAAYGTVFHDFAADCLEMGLEPHGFVGDGMEVEGFGWLEFDHEMADNMLAGLDLLWAMETDTTTLLVEKRVSLAEWVGEGEFGTTDAALLDPANWTITVFDWKYGQGVPVHPEENDQAILYALGTWSDIARDMFAEEARRRGIDPDRNASWAEDIKVQVMIEQPRAPGGGGTWVTTMGHLLREGRRIREDAALTEDPDAPFVPGEKQCNFCPAARYNTCEARARWLTDLMGLEFDDLDTDFMVGEESVLRRAMTPEQRSQVLLSKGTIEKYLKQLQEEAYKDAEMGREVPGMKMVAGRRGKRSFVDPVRAEVILKKNLGDEAFLPRALISPPQLEKLVGKKQYREVYARYVQMGESRPILVPESDPGEPIRDALSDLPDAPDEDDVI
jgi:hypothetical protein